MLRELTKSTNDDMKSEIQHRLQEAEKEIRKWKGWVDHFERQLNQKEGQLKKEGEFSVFNTINMTLYIQHAVTGAVCDCDVVLSPPWRHAPLEIYEGWIMHSG